MNKKQNSEELLEKFLSYIQDQNLELYPHQEEAILELFAGNNVILNTPTGSGKSLVALSMHFRAIALGRRSFYTCPIKALVNEKFLALCKAFGADQVGLMTGDANVNTSAPVICCTAEILANMSLREGRWTEVHDVIMDEFHYYSDADRGWAWQVPLLTMPDARFLLMSATLGDTTFFSDYLQEFTGVPAILVKSSERPVPLYFKYEELPLEMVLENLVFGGQAPIYVVNFSQREAANVAQNLLSTNYCSKEEKQLIAAALVEAGEDFKTPFGKEMQKLLRHGVGLHHAGLLPRYRVLTEKLAQRGLLKIICGTDTLGVGVNVPLRTVVFTKLCKFNGEKSALLTVREFHQIAGRAGRRGFDDQGQVVVMAPEHVIANKQMEIKKKKNAVKAKPPEKGYVPWDKTVFERLLNSPPEALKSSFKVTPGMLLSVLARKSMNGCKAMREMINTCHEADGSKRRLKSRAFQLFKALYQHKIIEIVDKKLQVHFDLQDEFSLHQTLSLYLIDTLKKVSRERETYALDVLSLVESICEDPEIILNKQLDKVKSQKIAEWKEAGMDYDERMEKLEELEYPKPLREFLYSTFNEFAALHPWIDYANISPKSIVREMYETFQSFNDYVKEYSLERAEGVLMRYLSQVYKVLVQTVPTLAKNEEINDIEIYLRSMIEEIDSSLIDEWEKMKNPVLFQEKKELEQLKIERNKEEMGILYDLPHFINLIRNKIFRLVRFLSHQQYAEFLNHLEDAQGFDENQIESIMENYLEDHEGPSIGSSARNRNTTSIEKEETSWLIKQTLVDEDGYNDWCLELRVDLEKSKNLGAPYIYFERIYCLGE